MKNKIFFSIVFSLITVFGIFLAVQNYQLRKELRYCQQVSKHFNRDDAEIDRINSVIDNHLKNQLEQGDFKWKMVIVYAPEDCPPCLDEITHWAMLNETEPDFGLWGIVNHPHEQLVAKFIKSMKWGFPNHIVKKSPFGENFGLSKTPIKVLLDNNNRIVFIEGPVTDWETSGRLKAFINELL